MVNDDRFNIREELRTKELVKQDELRNVSSIIRPPRQSRTLLLWWGTESKPPKGIIRCDSIYKLGYFANWKWIGITSIARYGGPEYYTSNLESRSFHSEGISNNQEAVTRNKNSKVVFSPIGRGLNDSITLPTDSVDVPMFSYPLRIQANRSGGLPYSRRCVRAPRARFERWNSGTKKQVPNATTGQQKGLEIKELWPALLSVAPDSFRGFAFLPLHSILRRLRPPEHPSVFVRC